MFTFSSGCATAPYFNPRTDIYGDPLEARRAVAGQTGRGEKTRKLKEGSQHAGIESFLTYHQLPAGLRAWETYPHAGMLFRQAKSSGSRIDHR